MSRSTVEPLERRMLFAGTISGIFFDDLNGNGVREAGEPGLKNQTVFADLNFNGRLDASEPRVVTGNDGSYTFSNAPNGIFRVMSVVPNGRRLTAPASVFYDVVIAGNTVASNRNFGNTTTAVIRGTVFFDFNRNTLRDVNEPGLAGWTVYIDKNNNGKFDPGEKSRVTNSRGDYRFAGLTPGTYRIRIVQQNGFVRTNPLSGLWVIRGLKDAQSVSARNFGQQSA